MRMRIERFYKIVFITNIIFFIIYSINYRNSLVFKKISTIYTEFEVILVQFFVILFFAHAYFRRRKKLKEETKENDFRNLVLDDFSDASLLINEEGLFLYSNNTAEVMFRFVDMKNKSLYQIDRLEGSPFVEKIKTSFIENNKIVYKDESLPEILGYGTFFEIHISPSSNDGKNRAVILIKDISNEYELNRKIKETYISTIKTMAKIVDTKDAYTGEHSKNVSAYVEAICLKLGVNTDNVYKIKTAASFHDIGKIGISDSILKKPGLLRDDEYEKMKEHPVLGSDIIKNVVGFDEIGDIVKHHHERWDGKGYPDKLKENEIPFGSQIIAIADTYDAIIFDRVYRKGRSKEAALDIILKEKGKQFNPFLVDVFVQMGREGYF